MRVVSVGWILACAACLPACGGSSKQGGSSGEASSSGGTNSSGTTSAASDGNDSSGGNSTETGASGDTDSTSSDGATGGDASGGTTAGDSTTGGASSGGASTGGASSGGASTGGSQGSGGTIGVDGGAGSPGSAGGDCTTAEDCELFQDCCACRAVERGALQASCRAACDQPLCDAQGVTDLDVACLAGRCVINRSCDDRNVICDVVTPNCSAGTVPEVEDGCYTGNCREVGQCASVSSCEVCKAGNLDCVSFEALGGPSYQCVSTRDGCDADDCECMGVCTSPFVCSQGSQTLACVCPVC